MDLFYLDNYLFSLHILIHYNNGS